MSIVEQRYQAVLAVLAGDPVTEVAEKVGVARQSPPKWGSRRIVFELGRHGLPSAAG